MVDLNDYYRVLAKIHRHLTPRTYVEIGVRHGESWRFAAPQCRSIGIDPDPRIHHAIQSQASLFAGTSDEFFASHNPTTMLQGLPIDLAFVDGMHQFEFALRDFANLERYASPDSIILLHDCLPMDEETSTREMNTSLWSGDIWKVVVCLKAERPDLQIDVFDTGPTGLAIVQKLDPTNNVLTDHYHSIEARYIDLPYAVIADPARRNDILNVVASDEANIERICGAAGRFHARHRRNKTRPARASEGLITPAPAPR